MNRTCQTVKLLLNGIDGGNPLGFLAALGTAILARSFNPDTRLYWCLEGGTWRPALQTCETDRSRFLNQLLDTMKAASMEAFEIDNKLPFPVQKFQEGLQKAQQTASQTDRRLADFLAAFGIEIHLEEGAFQDSRFRMVRSGDSAGQGLLSYARAIRDATDGASLERSLFKPWDYQDDGFSLRWDPIEDQRYALRWRDPSKSNLKDSLRTMMGANSLAIEALQWYPTMFKSRRSVTTGFHRNSSREVWFTWPIWVCPISLDTVRSLLALSELHCPEPPRRELTKRGIMEVYRSQRIQQNQYYSNFTPAQPA
jgi:hypothetical protein